MSLLEEALRRQRELEEHRHGPGSSSGRPVEVTPACERAAGPSPSHSKRGRLEMPDDPVPPALRERLRHADHGALPKASIFMPLAAIVVFLALFYARKAVMQIDDGTLSSVPSMPVSFEPEAPSIEEVAVEVPSIEEVPVETPSIAEEPIEEVPIDEPQEGTKDVIAVPEGAAPSLEEVPPLPSPVPADPEAWPLFKLKGIATGGVNLVMLDTGEMLAAGEKSKTGVMVLRVGATQATFSWHGENKTLRGGETSDKVADEETTASAE